MTGSGAKTKKGDRDSKKYSFTRAIYNFKPPVKKSESKGALALVFLMLMLAVLIVYFFYLFS
ncbi:MAG: hypothetical protein AB1898_25255 [Acidobacteriota bacterium]